MTRRIRPELSREMSLFQITMMGVGMMIGAGVFVATGIGIGMAGPGGMMLAFALNGLLALLSVMTYAELGSALPRAGGGYSYVQESSGGLTGFITGWISWFGHAVAGSLYSITFAKYTLHFLMELDIITVSQVSIEGYEKTVAILLALIFLFINYKGAKETGKAGAAIAIGQTFVLLLIGVSGIVFAFLRPDRLSNMTPFLTEGWGKVFIVMGFSLIGFEGYEVISNTAEEVIDARKNVPKGIFLAVIIVVTTYLMVAFAVILGGSVQGGSLADWFSARGATGFADAIANILPMGGFVAALAAIFASTSALNATIYSSTRVSFALGRDGHLPFIFEHISEKTRIPDVALLFSGSITILVVALFDVETVMAGASLFFIFLFNIVTYSGMKIRLHRGHELQYGYIIPFFPVIPVLSIAGRTMIGLFLLDMSLRAYLIAAIWLSLGFLYYFISPVKEVRGQTQREQKYGEPEEERESRRQVLVALSNRETAPVLIHFASIIASSKNLGLTLSTIVTVPYQTPINEASRFKEKAEELLMSDFREMKGILPVKRRLRYAHNPAEGIIQSIRSNNAEILVMGWTGKKSHRNFRMGSTLDPVIEKGRCNLVVIKPGNSKEIKEIRKILCPTKGTGIHTKLTWDVVQGIAAVSGADITIFHVTPPDKSGNIPDQLKNDLYGIHDNIRYKVKFFQSKNPISRICRESRDYDLVVIGASETSLFQRILFGLKPRKIAEGCDCPVIMVRNNSGIRSWFKRWFT